MVQHLIRLVVNVDRRAIVKGAAGCLSGRVVGVVGSGGSTVDLVLECGHQVVVLNDESDGNREGHHSGDEEEKLGDVTEGKIEAPV